MQKKVFLKKLNKELRRIAEEEHLSDLANSGRYAEVDEIESRIDSSAIEEYMEDGDDDWETLGVSEIANGRYLEFVSCLRSSGYSEDDIMEDGEDLQEALRGCGPAGEAAANTMNNCSVNVFNTYAEFMQGEAIEEDEEE